MVLGFLGLNFVMSAGGLVLVLLLVLAAVNFKSAKRTVSAVRDQAGKIGRWAQSADPVAALKQAIDDEGTNILEAQKTLAEANVLVRSVTRQVDANTADKTRYESRIRNALAAGDETKAREYAVQLARVEKDLATNSEQLEHHKAAYERAEKQIADRKDKLARLRQQAKSATIQLALSEQRANVAKNSGIGDYDEEGLQAKFDAVQAKIDQNEATAEVAYSDSKLDRYEAEDREAEMNAEADDVLARFKTQS